MSGPADLRAALDQLGAKWSPAFSRPGPLTLTARDCVLCGPDQDCRCAEIKFGSAEYFERLDRLHGRPKRDTSPPCDDPACPVTEQCGPHPRGIAIAATGRPSLACVAEPEVTR